MERLPESGSRGPACEPIGGEAGALGAAVDEPLELLTPPPEEEPPGKPVEEPPDVGLVTIIPLGPMPGV